MAMTAEVKDVEPPVINSGECAARRGGRPAAVRRRASHRCWTGGWSRPRSIWAASRGGCGTFTISTAIARSSTCCPRVEFVKHALCAASRQGREALARQTGLLDMRGRPVRGLPAQVVGGSIADAEAAWRGAFLAHGSLTEPGRSSALEVSCPGLRRRWHWWVRHDGSG